MKTLRSLLFNAYFFVSISIHLVTLLPAMAILGKHPGVQSGVRLWCRGMIAGAKWIAGLDWEVRGLEKLPEGPVIVASKHQSAWDTAVFYLLLSNPNYVLKKELLKIPVWGTFARLAEAVSVDRAGGMGALKKLVADVQDRMTKGRQVIIFPEGTRTTPGNRQPYHPGIAAIYAKTDAPVVPVALNSGLFWSRRSFVKHPGVITLEFLDPIPAGLDRKTFMKTLEERIETKSDALLEEARQRFPELPAPDPEV